HFLERVDWRRDCHFHTETTIDTLDYSGSGFNTGSKLVVAARGPAVRRLGSSVPESVPLPAGFRDPAVCLPGVMVIGGPGIAPRPMLDTVGDDEVASRPDAVWRKDIERLTRSIEPGHPLWDWPLVVIVDDPCFTAASLENLLWVTFTRSNPATDVEGCRSRVLDKHWGCEGPLVIDARLKPHHAPPVEEDPAITARINALATSGGPLSGILGD
ncbi:MAG: 3-octaprenyl-4-hydroxybenzoate carboxy-lyase, partial [Planctomycetaceae bacterium]